jgi:ankyrin repeat protein
MKITFGLSILILTVLSSCHFTSRPGIYNKENNSSIGKGFDFKLFENTPVSKLAKAVENEDISSIKEYILQDKLPMDFQENTFGGTLLQMALMRSKINSAIELLDLGANPNLRSPVDNSTPFLNTCKYIDISENSIEKLQLLLDKKANINDFHIVKRDEQTTDTMTAFDYILGSGTLEDVKLFVERGVDLKRYPVNGFNSLASKALRSTDLAILHFLLTTNKIPIPEYCVIREKEFGQANYKMTLTDLLNESTYSESDEKQKALILAYLKTQNKK